MGLAAMSAGFPNGRPGESAKVTETSVQPGKSMSHNKAVPGNTALRTHSGTYRTRSRSPRGSKSYLLENRVAPHQRREFADLLKNVSH
jgi:hypothetical protein